MVSKEVIQTVLGNEKYDLVIQNGKLVNTVTREVGKSTIGIKDGIVASVFSGTVHLDGERVVNADGYYIVPALIDVFASYSKSMLHPYPYANFLFSRGVTTTVSDMYSVAEVFGREGVENLLEIAKELPLHMYFSAPIQIPAFEDKENIFDLYTENDFLELLSKPEILCASPLIDIEEIFSSNQRMETLRNSIHQNKTLASDLTWLSEKDKQAAQLFGVTTEILNEKSNVIETLRRGQYACISHRFLSEEKIKQLLEIEDRSKMIFNSGSEWIYYHEHKGHLDEVLRKAIFWGMDPVEAIQCATWHPAQCMGLNQHGALFPGMQANLFLTKDLKSLKPELTLSSGSIVMAKNKFIEDWKHLHYPENMMKSVHIKRKFAYSFELPETEQENPIARVLVGNQNTFNFELELTELSKNEKGEVICPEFCNKVFLYNRQTSSNFEEQVTLIKGIGKIKGAVATTYAPHTHPLLVIGTNDDDMSMATNMLIASGGGMVAIQNGKLLQSVDLPIGGIGIDTSAQELAERLEAFNIILRDLMGINHKMPLDWLTSICDTTLGGYRITSKGIIDTKTAQKFSFYTNETVVI